MPDESAFSYETLSKQDAAERKQPRLTQLDPNFWQKLNDYLRGLEQNLRNESVKSPSSRKIALIQDELRNATRKAESVWEMREKKITLYALKNSRVENAPPPENALKGEQTLYVELIAAFRKNQPPVVHAIDKPTDGVPIPAHAQRFPPMSIPASPAVAVPMPSPQPAVMPVVPGVVAAPSPGSASAAPSSGARTEDAVTVRALVDVPPFVGLDGKTYRLKKGDVLTLPKKMVDMLAKRGQVAVMA